MKMTSTESLRGPVSPNLRLGPSFRARARSGGATGLGGPAKQVARPVERCHISSVMHPWMQNTAGHGKSLTDPPRTFERGARGAN